MAKKSSFPTDEEIRAKAYQIYLEHGQQSGHDLDDWRQAEYELMHLPVGELNQLEPPQRKKGSRQSLVALVHAAVLFGAKALPHLKG